MENKEITITLKAAEWNYVLSAIATRPYAECVKLIEEINKQAEAQLQEAPVQE